MNISTSYAPCALAALLFLQLSLTAGELTPNLKRPLTEKWLPEPTSKIVKGAEEKTKVSLISELLRDCHRSAVSTVFPELCGPGKQQPVITWIDKLESRVEAAQEKDEERDAAKAKILSSVKQFRTLVNWANAAAEDPSGEVIRTCRTELAALLAAADSHEEGLVVRLPVRQNTAYEIAGIANRHVTTSEASIILSSSAFGAIRSAVHDLQYDEFVQALDACEILTVVKQYPTKTKAPTSASSDISTILVANAKKTLDLIKMVS